MVANSLKFVIIFKKAVTDASVVKKKGEEFFINYHERKNIKCIVTVTEPKVIDFDLVYKTDLCEIIVNLQYPETNAKFNPGDHLSNIGKLWCDPQTNELFHLWLRLINSSVLQNKGKQFHSDVDIKEIAFGTFPTMQYFMQHYHYESFSNESEIVGTFLHSQRHFIVYLCSHKMLCKYEGLTYKFQVQYKSISRVIINDIPNEELVQIYFHLQHIPLIYNETLVNEESEMKSGSRVFFLASDQEYQERRWERSLAFGCICNKSRCYIERIGKCLVFKVVISRRHRAYGIVERMMQRCPASTLFYFCGVNSLVSKKKLENFELFPHNTERLNLILDKNVVNDIKFSCQYAWEVVLGRSLEIEDQILLLYILDLKSSYDPWEHLKNIIKTLCEKNRIALVNALHHIGEMISKNNIFLFGDALGKLFEHYHKTKYKLDLPEGMCLVRRLVITPSRTIPLVPSEHFDNRVIRKYTAENMLRVSIQDDDFSKLTFAVQYHSDKNNFMDRVMRNILLQGLKIGPKSYEVLASSNSQLREHGLWMYAKDYQGNTAESIRKWMGDFRHIRNVAKYMARMGQCFSSSEESVQLELQDKDICILDEIKTDDGKYVFSDGIGMISKDLAQEVQEALLKKLPLSIHDSELIYDPMAFQIRFKGCKGMVAESETLPGHYKLGIRPSMDKFKCSTSNILEIVKISAPRSLFLNRPLITILEQLGVKATVFLKLQKEMVIDITDSLVYERKACKMLTNLTSLDYPYKSLLKAGICITQEPFFRSLLLSVYRSCIDQLKTKARIAISPAYGRNMLGILDETLTLEYGQVFVQYSEKLGNIFSPTKILKGTVVVTKNPCMHPGDVRKLEAVDVPALHHVKDCIVFPAKGKRPHPDEMAGSDLDGDEYVVIWLKELIFPNENYPAMDYPPNRELIHNGSIMVHDMIDFLCTFIQSDNVGVLANAHLAWADAHPDGIFSNICMKIAKKYPLVLDFAKSGSTCYLSSQEKPKQYPDFMEKGCTNNSYKSMKALGLLYRVIRNLEASVSKINMGNQFVVPDSYLQYSDWETYKESAEYHMREYSKRVKNILRKYGLQSETEALTGYVGKVSDCCQNRYEKTNLISLSKTYLMDTIKRYRMQFIMDCENECRTQCKSRSELKEIQYKRASAWYMAAYTNPDSSVLSFPWVVSDILAEVRKKNLKKNNQTNTVPRFSSSFIQSSDSFLLGVFEDFFQYTDGKCRCITIMYNTVKEWMMKTSVLVDMSADNVFCFDCFQRIVDNFMKTTQTLCCSFDYEGCTCSESCSPMTILMKFMKFYATEVTTNIGACTALLSPENICEGFQELNLQSVALQTYASLAVTRNMTYLGLIDNTLSVPEDDGIYEEGDPIRIPVTKDFEPIITHHMDELSELLKRHSGVKDIFINGDRDRRGNWFLLVHSTGKAWQRWNLEEFIMDHKSAYIIKSKLQASSKSGIM